MFMDLNMTQVEFDALPAVVSISKDSGLQLAEASQQNATIMLWLPHYSSFDFNVVLLWVMAVGTFIVAGIWAARDSTGNEHAYLKAEGNQEVGRLPTIELQGHHVEGGAEDGFEAEGEVGDGIEGGVEAESVVAASFQHQLRKVCSCSKCTNHSYMHRKLAIHAEGSQIDHLWPSSDASLRLPQIQQASSKQYKHSEKYILCFAYLYLCPPVLLGSFVLPAGHTLSCSG